MEIWDLINFKVHFLSTRFLDRGLALLQQFVDDACSVDGKKQDLKVAQSAKVDSVTVPLQQSGKSFFDMSRLKVNYCNNIFLIVGKPRGIRQSKLFSKLIVKHTTNTFRSFGNV